MPDTFEILAWLGAAVVLIVALIAFKRAGIVKMQAETLLFDLNRLKTLSDLNELRDELADLAESVDRNRDTLARLQGRRTKVKALDERLPDAREDPAAWKREMRKRIHLTGTKE